MSRKSTLKPGHGRSPAKDGRPRSGKGSWKRENQWTNPKSDDERGAKKPLDLSKPKQNESIIRARTREIAEQVARDGVTPLEVMLTNMRWAHNHSLELLSNFEAFVRDHAEWLRDQELDSEEEAGEKKANRKTDPIAIARMMMREFIDMRKLTQQFAVDAAPYVHPRLASVEWKPSSGDEDIAVIKRIVIDGKARASD